MTTTHNEPTNTTRNGSNKTEIDRFRIGDHEAIVSERLTRKSPEHPHHCDLVVTHRRLGNEFDEDFTLEDLVLVEELIHKAKNRLFELLDGWP